MESISTVIQPWILHFSSVIILCPPDKFYEQGSEVNTLLVLWSMDPRLITIQLVIAGNKTSGSAWNTGSFFYYYNNNTTYCRTKKLSVYLGLSTCTFAIWKLTSVILVSLLVSATYVNGHASSCLLCPYGFAGLYYKKFIIYTVTEALLQTTNYFLCNDV
jgi:hypothetical protein